MPKILSFQWPCQAEWKPVSEDEFFVNADRGIFVVADGVTRRGFSGPYPDPSPARAAAKATVKSFSDANRGQFTERQMHKAFKRANESVRAVNRSLGLWDDHDWWGRDLAGAVAAGLVIQEALFVYGFIADCGVAQISAESGLLWHTPDLLAPAEKHFPSVEELGQKERFIRVRRDFRNRPEAKHPTYGVLTGEEAALSYVQVGARPYGHGEVLAVYSDGAAPFVIKDSTFQQLLGQATEAELSEYVAQHSSSEQNADEKTLIVIRT